jgi:imidazolonepropionase-like amidohydrolase/ABC-type multidrug transport system permease subunit
MNAYLMLIKTDVRLAFRQRVVIFFNYLMPFTFFFVFAKAYHAEQGGAILQVVAMVTVIGILGNGLFGAGLRAAQDREANILRRYKVAPISPLPLLVASTVTGLVIYMPFILAMLAIAVRVYGMKMPAHIGELIVFILLGVTAVRALGLIVASVVNSMQESNIILQILYMAMLFLSGASFPTTAFPSWLMDASQVLPATWLMSGIQGMMLRNETLVSNWQATGALALTTIIGLFLSVKLFRWEKEEKMRPTAKLWVLAVLVPFVALAGWQAYAKDNVRKMRIIDRDMKRSRTLLIRNARIFIGNGSVIENGGVLIKDGKIAEVYDGNVPDAKSVDANDVDGAGKTVLPGLIDAHVHLGGPAGSYDNWRDYDAAKIMQRNLAAYLYSGVTAVRSAGDRLDLALKTRAIVNGGEKLGAEFFTVGPLFTAEGGHGTEILRNLPGATKDEAQAQFTRTPKSAEDARQQVDTLRKAGVDGIKTVLDAGVAGQPFNRMSVPILDAVVAAAHADKLSAIVHTGDPLDVEDAIRAHVDGIEHGSMRRLIPDEDFVAMAKAGIAYDPTLSVAEAFEQFVAGKTDLLNRSLVQQVGPPALLKGTMNAIRSPGYIAVRKGYERAQISLAIAKGNLMRAYHAGVTLVTGSDAGNLLVFHGPTVQRELELWADAGVPVPVALQAATLKAAKALRADARFGSVEKGKDATLLLVDGNPLLDIRAVEAVSMVIFKGERVNRAELLKPD